MPKDKARLRVIESPVDAETRSRDDHHLSVRLWLRLLSCTNRIETLVRQKMQASFQTTLPRFDLMAQLCVGIEGERVLAFRTVERNESHAFGALPLEVLWLRIKLRHRRPPRHRSCCG
jgi:hypothetical protein